MAARASSADVGTPNASHHKHGHEGDSNNGACAKAAAAAVSVAETCAQAVVRDLTQRAMPDPRWHAGCFSLAAPGHGFEASTDFFLAAGHVTVDKATQQRSTIGASAEDRRTDAEKAELWLQGIMGQVWG